MSFYTNGKSGDLLVIYLPLAMRERNGIQVIMDLNYQKLPSYPDSRLGYLQTIINEASHDNKNIILCDVTIDSPTGGSHPVTGAVMAHSVALKIDLENQKIIYQDPKGYGLLGIMREDLIKALPEFKIIELKRQQQDKYNVENCGPITVENIRHLATFDDVEPSIDVVAVRRQHDEDLAASNTNQRSPG